MSRRTDPTTGTVAGGGGRTPVMAFEFGQSGRSPRAAPQPLIETRRRVWLKVLLGQRFLAGILAVCGGVPLSAEEEWKDISSPLLERLTREDPKSEWPGGCSGVVVNRLSGAVTIKVVGRGLWQSPDGGESWKRIDEETVSGRDETGWATTNDQNSPDRIASFSLDGQAGWSTDGMRWRSLAGLGRNWDFGSVDWSVAVPATIVAAKHETDPPGEAYASADGGATWRQLSIHLAGKPDQLSMCGALGATTFIYSNGNGIYRSADSGATWSKVLGVTPQTRIPVFFKGAHYLGTSNGLIVSHDRGANWHKQGADVDVWLGPFFGATESDMLVVGSDGAFFSADAGNQWTKAAALHPNLKGFSFGPKWFGCYAWDPVHHFLYASCMGHPVFRIQLGAFDKASPAPK